MITNIHTFLSNNNFPVILTVHVVQHWWTRISNSYLITFDYSSSPTQQLLLNRFTSTWDILSISLKTTIFHIIIVVGNSPLTSFYIQMPWTKWIKIWSISIKWQRTPLIISQSVPCKISPSIPAINDSFFFTSSYCVKKACLRDMSIVCSTSIHYFHVIRRHIRAPYIIGHQIIRIRRIPAIQIRSTHIIFTFIFEHTVSFTTFAMKNLCTV